MWITQKSKSMFRFKDFVTYVNLSFLDSESSAKLDGVEE